MSISALIDCIVELETAGQRQRSWTDSDVAFVRDNLPRLGPAGVGRELGRSPEAIKIIQVRRQIPASSKRSGFYTANRAAKILGVDIHALTRLEQIGEIRFDVLPGPRRIRQIGRISLWVWAIHPDHWIYFKANRIRDPRLRRLVQLRQAKWNDEWWTTGQIARRFGLANSKTVEMAICRGRLKARRWGNWYVKRSDALAYRWRAGKGSQSGYDWSARADAFLLKARDEWGLEWAAIGKLMKWSPRRAAYRYRLLREAWA